MVNRIIKFEPVIILLFLLLFIVINVKITLDVQPVWLDEVTVEDPAVNLFLGNGFTSTGWQYQQRDEFWASNAPLHQIILYHWMHLFGFNPVSARAINYFIHAVTLILIWLTVKRLDLIKSVILRLLLILTLICGAGITINYIAGRYDCIGILLLSIILFSFSIKIEWIKTIFFTFASILIPFAGINLIPYVFIMFFLSYFFIRKELLKDYLVIFFGIMFGALILYFFYVVNDVASSILVSAGGHGFAGAIDHDSIKQIGESDLNGKLMYFLFHLPQIFIRRLSGFLRWYFQDPSLLFLILYFIAMLITERNNLWKRKLSKLIIVFFCIVPLVMGLLRDYPFYYTWMAFLPISICLFIFADRYSSKKWHLPLFMLVVFLCCLPGWPRRVISMCKSHNDYKIAYYELESFINDNIDSDFVYSEFEAYYFIKKKSDVVLLPTYLDMMTKQDKNDIDQLIIKKENYDKIVSYIGGKWKLRDSFDGPAPYDIVIYDREITN